MNLLTLNDITKIPGAKSKKFSQVLKNFNKAMAYKNLITSSYSYLDNLGKVNSSDFSSRY